LADNSHRVLLLDLHLYRGVGAYGGRRWTFPIENVPRKLERLVSPISSSRYRDKVSVCVIFEAIRRYPSWKSIENHLHPTFLIFNPQFLSVISRYRVSFLIPHGIHYYISSFPRSRKLCAILGEYREQNLCKHAIYYVVTRLACVLILITARSRLEQFRGSCVKSDEETNIRLITHDRRWQSRRGDTFESRGFLSACEKPNLTDTRYFAV